MFGLRNELFGFPVNSCDYENIECNKSYVPILNWDNDNEFVWSLWDPIEWGVDASNVTFNSKDIQKRPSSVKKVDQALETLMNMIEDSKSTIKSFTFTLNKDWETLEWNIVYEDDSWTEYTKTASINLKDIVEWWQVLTLKDIIADSIEADEWIFESAQAWWLDVTWDVIIQWNETVNWTVVMNSTLDVAWKATINWWADITWNLNVLADSETQEGWEIHSKSLETTENATIGWDLSVAWNETVSGNISSTWDAIIWWDISVTWDANITWIATVSEDLNVWWDIVVTDDLTVNWTTHLNALETTWSVDVAWTLRVDWAIDAWNWVSVTWQVESDSLVTWNAVIDTLHVRNGIYLENDAVAPDFVLQDEKWQPNWVAPLDANWKIDAQYLPPVNLTWHLSTAYGRSLSPLAQGLSVSQQALRKSP